MAIFRTHVLLLPILCCLFPSLAAASDSSLPDEVCRNFKDDYQFCIGIINSEPNLPPTDPINIAYSAFRSAAKKAGDILNEIESEINRVGHSGKPSIIRGLNNCLDRYNQATRTLSEAMGDLDSESYNFLVELSVDAKNSVAACYNGYRNNREMNEGNVYVMKVIDICHAVALII